jgi:hemerythrin-like domain-containing protein
MTTRQPDAIAVLTADHRTVEEIFRRFEEQLFYPRLRLAGREMKDEVLEALEEHHVVKELLAEIEKLPPENERFGAKVTVLIENVRHHIEEEEGDMFPRARRALSRAELVELGEGLEALKALAPTRPHPHAPDEPPANLANLGVAGVDRARDAAESTVEMTGRVVRAALEKVARGR